MHLQQTKRRSIASGGPQYYFHDLSAPVKTYLRDVGAVKVALVTPYGATRSNFFAVSHDKKIDGKKIIPGKVGHDRIQQGRASKGIGESIRFWYKLRKGDFERIDINIDIIDDVFYLAPVNYKYASSRISKDLALVERPLTLTSDYISPLWKAQIKSIYDADPKTLLWSLGEVCRVVKDHLPKHKLPHIQEADLLRTSGPLNILGVALGGYVGKGFDCISKFKFLNYPAYTVPVEVKKYSKGFKYQLEKYGKDELSRAVILCAFHDNINLSRNIDVIELAALCKYIKQF